MAEAAVGASSLGESSSYVAEKVKERLRRATYAINSGMCLTRWSVYNAVAE